MKNGLLDFLQAASNAVAGNVTGPVDLLGMGLNKIGVPVGNAPVGGSEWMKQRGLMRDVQPGAARVLGETAGLLGPALLTKFAPEIAGGLLKGADNLAAPRTLNPQTGAVVWHGSPHKFDKFDSGKIGTGEGAQAYGHGLYLAESPDVAKSYVDALARRQVPQNMIDDGSPAFRALAARVNSGDDLGVAADALRGHAWADVRAAKDKIAALPRDGALYKVDLPDEHIAKMLDWDKPLSQQSPKVRAAVMATKKQLTPDDIENLGGAGAVRALYDPANKIDNFLGTWESLRGKRDAGETLLRQQGIPGIRYLDGGSRGAGSGSSNFVVFPGNEGLLSILERNGQALR